MMPYKNKEDKQRWKEDNKDKQITYRKTYNEKHIDIEKKESQEKKKLHKLGIELTLLNNKLIKRLNSFEFAINHIKECSKCGEVKPFTSYHKDITKKYKLSDICIDCKKPYLEKYKQDNSEYIKQRDYEYHQLMLDTKPGYAEKFGLRKTVTFIIKPIVLKRDNFTCVLCNSNSTLIVHHILPATLDINNEYITDINNLVTLCKQCHLYKAHEGSWTRLSLEVSLKLTAYIQQINQCSLTPTVPSSLGPIEPKN